MATKEALKTLPHKTVVTLTYHEITQDPRVFKQARALVEAGHQVHAFCAQLPGFVATETVQGIKITRFDWEASDWVRPDSLADFPFLKRSKQVATELFEPFAQSATRFHQKKAGLAELITPQDWEKLDLGYYKKFKGKERKTRKAEYLKTNLKLTIKQLPKRLFGGGAQLNPIELRGMGKSLGRDFRDLYQLTSLVFAGNLQRVVGDLRPDVVHAHDLYCLPGGINLAQSVGAKLIYDAHEYEPSRATKMQVGSEDFVKDLEDDCLEHVDHLITVAAALADLYGARFAGPPPSLIFNAPEVDLDNVFTASDTAPHIIPIRTRAAVSDQTPLVVFTGGIQQGARGMDKVLEALTELPEVHLATLGPRHEASDEWFLKHAETFGVKDRVHLCDAVPAADVCATIQSANAAIIPIQDASISYRFSMPNKLFEAAFAGLPICVSNLPEMLAFVTDLGIGRGMDQTDPHSIAGAVRDVLDNPQSYEAAPEKREKLATYYSWPAQVSRLLAIYDTL
ncbi:glycosyltransferase family 4 protein [Algirhabdus cladophorae]|uniref:glycosyltransferase family 4 protein n=1 Tax=Algirhabdus cladophorae TaxID=3377108 RepID=UPI003B847E35